MIAAGVGDSAIGNRAPQGRTDGPIKMSQRYRIYTLNHRKQYSPQQEFQGFLGCSYKSK